MMRVIRGLLTSLRGGPLVALTVAACGGREPRQPTADDSARVEASASVVADAPASKFPPGSVILFAGTSLTAGYGLDPDSAYPQQVQRMIDSVGLKFQVVNAGVSGETSSALLRRLSWLMREPFELIVIETGANDGMRGVPVATLEQNLQRIIDGVRAGRPRAQIALVQMEAPPNMGIAYTTQFRDVFPAMARKNNVALLPFLLDGVAGVRHLNQGDGIHPNEDGERIVAQNVFKALKPLLQ
jgi:acyl-CoA thioesterase-1